MIKAFLILVRLLSDTGSHHTAFPCVGCKCGKHMDPYFDPQKSSTAVIKTCNRNQRCMFKQSYSEGSSWHAFKVSDKVWIGGENEGMLPAASRLTVNFDFGCQSMETGLFRTQNVDGIMGFSGMADTFPHQLVAQKVIKSKLFTMCFRIGGGLLTLGGVDSRIHERSSPVLYAGLTKSSGWFTVKLIDILLRDPTTMTTKSIGEGAMKYNGGKGTIVDSGTTDTYLPASVRSAFERAFSSQSGGMKYSNARTMLSHSQFLRLPTIVYRIAGKYTDFIDIECPPSSYAEQLKQDRDGGDAVPYAFRVYLTEGSGTVLGANFMNGHNVIFDIQKTQIGFVKSSCNANDNDPRNVTAALPLLSPSSKIAEPLHSDTGKHTNNDAQSSCKLTLMSGCDARCKYVNNNVEFPRSYTVQNGKHLSVVERTSGFQIWRFSNSACYQPSSFSNTFNESCTISCTTEGYVSPQVDRNCVNSVWSTCSKSCHQTRVIFQPDESDCSNGVIEQRQCNVFECPIRINDHIVSLQLTINFNSAALWTVFQAEDLIVGLSKVLKVCHITAWIKCLLLIAYC